MAKEKDIKNEIAPKAEDSKKEKAEEEEIDVSEENLVEEEKEAEAEGKEQDYNSIFDDDYDPDSDESSETEESEDEADEDNPEEVDNTKEADGEGEAQTKEKSKESSSKKSSNDKKKDTSGKKEKTKDTEEKPEDDDGEIILDNHRNKGEKDKGYLVKKVLISLAIILALLAGAFGGYLYFKSTDKPKEEPTPVKTEESKEEKAKKEVYVTADGGLNLREEADSSSKSLALIPKGTKLTVLEEKDGWYKVEYDGQQGWVSKDYASETKPDDWKTYSGSGFLAENPKFSVKYPSDWTLNGYKISKTDSGKTYMIALGEGGHGFAEDDSSIVSTTEDIAANGFDGKKTTVKKNGKVITIYTQFLKGDGYINIEFNLPDDYNESYIDIYDKIVETFKFL